MLYLVHAVVYCACILTIELFCFYNQIFSVFFYFCSLHIMYSKFQFKFQAKIINGNAPHTSEILLHVVVSLRVGELLSNNKISDACKCMHIVIKCIYIQVVNMIYSLHFNSQMISNYQYFYSNCKFLILCEFLIM